LLFKNQKSISENGFFVRGFSAGVNGLCENECGFDDGEPLHCDGWAWKKTKLFSERVLFFCFCGIIGRVIVESI
jgi:hypothetical protein